MEIGERRDGDRREEGWRSERGGMEIGERRDEDRREEG